MKKLAVVFFAITALLVSSCANFDTEEGVVWTYNLENELAAGVELGSETIYFADASGWVYALHMRTGNLKWTKQALDVNSFVETVKALYSGTTNLYVLSYSSWEGTFLRQFDSEQGELLSTTELTLDEPNPGRGVYTNYSDGKVYMIAYSDKKLAVVNLATMGISYLDVSSHLNSDESIVRVMNVNQDVLGDYFYAISDKGKVLRFDESAGTLTYRDSSQYSGEHAFYGSAIYADDKLFIGTADGLLAMLDDFTVTPTWQIISSTKVASTRMATDSKESYLFAAFAEYPNAGIKKYEMTDTGADEDWTYQTFDNTSYSSVVYSEFYALATVIDDSGNLSVVDDASGMLITSRSIGINSDPDLEIAYNETEQIMFIPISVGSKVICYDLSYPDTLMTQSKE
jgi:outer membrane protein assembly factor BamB